MGQVKASTISSGAFQGTYLVWAILLISTLYCNGQEICLQAVTSVEFLDQAYQEKEKFEEKTTSSEKFVKEMNSFSNSVTVGYGPTLGFMGIEVGYNIDVTTAWSKTTESTLKTTDYKKVTKSEKLTFLPNTRQLYRKTETTTTLVRKGTGSGSVTATHTKEEYAGVVDPEVCGGTRYEDLRQLAKDHISRQAANMKEAKVGRTVEIMGDGTSLKTEICGIEGKYTSKRKIFREYIFKIIFDLY